MLFGKPHSAPLTDAQLVHEFRTTGKRKYAGQLFDRFGSRVLGVCLKYLRQPADAEDATIEIFEHTFKKLPQTDVLDFGAWIHRIAINHCLMILRKTKREIPTEFLEAAELPDERDTLLDENLEKLSGLIAGLNEGQSLCIRLFYLEEKSYRQIAEQTGMNILTVKSNIQNGKRNLSIKLKAEAGIANRSQNHE